MTNKYTPTVSQNFDLGEFISPDIVSHVDASVRSVADDILEHGIEAEEFDKVFSPGTEEAGISDMTVEYAVPSMDPDKFIVYEPPSAPNIPDLSDAAPVIASQEEAVPAHEEIIVEIPQVSRYNSDMMKVKLDTLFFDRKFRDNVRVNILIAILVVVLAMLLVYLLTQ